VSPAPDQLQALYQLMGGYRVSQAIYVVAQLGIADLLKDGPRGSDDLAGATGAHAETLHRVLRFLTGVGLFSEVAPGRFALTPLGAGLRADVPGSIRPMTLMLLDYSVWQPWGHLLHSVRTGETAFEHVHGLGRFDYLAAHPDTGALFNAAMTGNTAWSGTAITAAYDFAGIDRLVDVGGGHGLLLATILRAHPDLRGVLFDRPAVVAGAGASRMRPSLSRADIASVSTSPAWKRGCSGCRVGGRCGYLCRTPADVGTAAVTGTRSAHVLTRVRPSGSAGRPVGIVSVVARRLRRAAGYSGSSSPLPHAKEPAMFPAAPRDQVLRAALDHLRPLLERAGADDQGRLLDLALAIRGHEPDWEEWLVYARAYPPYYRQSDRVLATGWTRG